MVRGRVKEICIWCLLVRKGRGGRGVVVFHRVLGKNKKNKKNFYF
jgi:hypothetical protein